MLAWVISLGGTLSIILGLYLAHISYGIENFSKNVSLPIYSIIPGVLVIVSIWSVSRSKPVAGLPRKSLLFLTIAFCCWFIAEQVWNLYEHVLEIDPYPSIADFFYISAPMFMFVSLLGFLKSQERKISKKEIVFASIISGIILIPLIFFVYEEYLDSNYFEILVALSYPIMDSILLVPVIIAFLFIIPNKKNFFWIMILLGIICMIIADDVFLFLVVNDDYVDGHLIDILWISAYTIWAFMMFYSIIQSKQKSQKTSKETSQKQNEKNVEKYGVFGVLVLINVTIVLLLLAINNFSSSDGEILLYFSLILIITVIIFSSMVVMLNARLNKSLQIKTKQLEDASKEIVKSERFTAIGELASRISHDIRNPLSNIYMSIELIKKTPPETNLKNEVIQERINTVSKNIERISHQVNHVLSFVKNQPTDKKRFPISSCLKEAVDAVKIPANISLKTSNIDTEILADPFQIQIVFNNLLINAIQAIGQNSGEIFLQVANEEKETILEVSNSGPEIPKDILPHIFESLVTTKQVGTGLGLVSCKTIIENHNGTIMAKNYPTTFTIKIPSSS